MQDNKTWQQTREGGSCDALQVEAVRHRASCSSPNASAYQISAQTGSERLSRVSSARFQRILREPLVFTVRLRILPTVLQSTFCLSVCLSNEGIVTKRDNCP